MLFAQENAEDKKFNEAVDKYLDAFWKFYPTAGTMVGFHKYDKELEDLSSKNIGKRHTELDELNQEFVAKIDRFALSPELQIDHEIIVEALDMELIRHESVVPWAYNPLFYNDIFANCVKSLMTGDQGTAEDRAKNAVERLKDLEKLVKQAKENLQTPAQIYTQTAIDQFPGILDFYKLELPGLIGEAPASQQSKLNENMAKAVAALEDWQNFLQNELLAKSTGNFRLAGAHTRLLRILLKSDLPIQEVIARATADEKNIRRDMVLVCAPFFKIMDPPFDMDSPPAGLSEDQYINAVVSHVLGKMNQDHVSKDEYFQVLENQKAEIKSFIQDRGIIELPDVDVQLKAVPVNERGYSFTRFIRPSAYETAGDYSLEIGVIADEMDDASLNSLLEEYNNYFIPFWVMRNVFPGEFVPYYISNQNTTSLVRKLYPNMPMIKGWPVFVEEMMIKSGFGNYDLRLRLNQLKYRLKAAMDMKIELNIHQGGMTEEQAVAYMTRMGFQSEAEAKQNWNNICLYPGDAIFTYVGLQEFLDMEKDYQTKMGDSYSKKEFLQKLLSFGNLPLRHLKKKMNE
jgi:hypothetical protein